MLNPTVQEVDTSLILESMQPCSQFSYSEIQVATQNFDESLVIGCGGFGKVYKGTIIYKASRLTVAVKRLDSTSNQGASEFWAEVKMLSKLRHSHLVSLIGYCNDGQEMVLVYDYMPHGTLADRLHKHRVPLTWVRRLKICIGAARGLDYLHTDMGIKPRVIHRDVKSSNILLDNKWAAKISDFGLSKIGPIDQRSTYVKTLVKGTFGYIDPDYFHTGKLTRKSDVYAFGVVLFEVLCGKQAVDRSIDEEHWGLATWAQDSIKEGKLKHIVDSNLKGTISSKCLKEFAQLAVRCLHNHPKQRPTMAEVVVGLESILASQEKYNKTLLPVDIKIFGIRVPAFLFPSSRENSVATENFSEANLISEDIFGFMHKGKLQNGHNITIVGPYSNTKHGLCMNEVSILVKLEHENLVQLIGYCIDGTNVFLVYDFAPYSTLDCFIYDRDCAPLDWDSRCKIILGVARALEYLHAYSPIRIIHRDVRPDNILLDYSLEPKLSCFSLAACYTIDEPGCFNVVNYGTTGHMAPESFLDNGCLTTKADVFSFGIAVLETISGYKIYNEIPGTNKWLVDYVWSNWIEGTYTNILDPWIDADSSSMRRFTHIALLCIQDKPTMRPTMDEVLAMLLDSSSIDLPIPNEPRWAITNDLDDVYASESNGV
ncbi:concanavalin A-like lectin/glucanase domain, Serine/threonine-protein kinase Rad53 [Artemisia annua]|uniref:Concanavalin A-like lectin/glucanase domain, Serine/threonine-protein kinase Rad53 n=1 Tax=Artemisia annua TaxID=35608 RepID=A0A2U1MJH6_ARTAN|nr:concanavalin A-like lectin/glucanase domain, Serine/threonine-protein kinase Rad53 [Artemisia annua]